MTKNKKEWVNYKTGDKYDISHTTPTIYTFEVKLSKDSKKEKIPVNVFFSNHCYSKECYDGNDTIHFSEKKRSGDVENRTFCIERWGFSKKLPAIISGLGAKTCLQGNKKELLYRLEDKDPKNPEHGWYICMKMSYRANRTPSIELSIRSIHRRTNKPLNIKGGNQRFYVLLSKLINAHKKAPN